MTPSAADSFLAKGNVPRTILRAALVGALWMSPAVRGDDGVPSRTATGQRPNIILCMTDDQGWGDVSYNGLKQIKTPALDAMAAAGIRFNRFYAAHPSCSPTRASVMTGRHPYRMGVFWPGVAIRTQEVTIAQAVKTAGYATGHFGKWHLNGVAGPGKVIPNSDPCSPRNLGFDESFSVSNYFETNWTFGRNGVPEKTTGDGSDVIVAEVLKFIEGNAKRNKPFLAVVWFGSPHVPHKPLPEDLEKAGGSAYYGELVGVDRGMGTLRSGLRKLGIADNTMLWFCSDNGSWLDAKAPDAHGSNGVLRGKKGELWEGGIRVPGLIEWPARIRRPAVSDVPVCTSDIYPTIVEILNLKVPNQVQPLDGISLVPLLDGKMKERPSPIGFWHPDGDKVMGDLAAWNDNRYKLLTLPGHRCELYDLTADLGEKTDIAAQHPEVVARMKAELEQWQQSVRRSNRGEDYPDKATVAPPTRGLEEVHHAQVELRGGFWGPRLKTHQAVTIPHALDCLEKDGHVTNFDKAAGLLQGPPSGHRPFDSDLHKALEGAMYVLQHGEDAPLRKRVEGILDRILAAQQEDGFLIFHFIAQGLDKKWDDLRLDHQMYNAGHFFEMAVEQHEAVGHAVRAGYMYAAMTDIVRFTDAPGYQRALDHLWNDVVSRKMYLTGGIGTAQYEDEGFGDPYLLPNEAYCESCAAIAHVLWQHRMNLLKGEAKYADVMELTLYNGVLSGIAISGDKFFYQNPLVKKGGGQRSSWIGLSCCPTNLARIIPQVGGLVYAWANREKGPMTVWIDQVAGEETAKPAEEARFNRKPEGHTKNKQRAAVAYEANLKNHKDDKNVLVLPGLIADKKRQRVEVLVERTGLGRESPCEFTIIDETSEHGYEALLISLAKPSAIHQAIKFIGKEPGEPFDPEAFRFWAKGESFVLSLVKDKEPSVRLEKLLVDRRTGKTLPEQGFLFTGSRMVPDFNDPKKQVYAADYYQPKAVVSLFNSTHSVLEVPYRAAKSDVYQNTVVNPEHALAEGALLTLVIEPADKEHPRRPKDLVLHVQPGNAATDEPATAPERVNRLKLQLKDSATMLNAEPTLRSFIAALAALDKKQDWFLTVAFGDDVTLGDAQSLARILSVIDSEKGIRIDPPAAGQLYYGAFLPAAELLDRDARVDHPWELSLTEKAGRVSGELLLIDSVWKENVSKPELAIVQLPVSGPKDLRKELDAEAERTKLTGRMAKPAAIMVFAPATLKYGQLTKFLGTALSTHKMLQVYVDVPQPPVRKTNR